MKSIHLICNAHLDPVWLWDWEEGAAAAVSTFRSAVSLAKEFDYIFCHNESLLFSWIQEYDPALFRDLQAMAEEGKLHIMGGWFLQPDVNMPTGESLVRQIMEGRRYFSRYFHQEPTTAMNVDPFGHSLGLPQILRGCGYDSYIIGRPYPCQSDFPDNFLWEGRDGSRVRVHRIPDGYLSLLGQAKEKIQKSIELQKDRDRAIVFWGVGNHGGGPSRQDLRDIGELQKQSPVPMLHSWPEAFMAEDSGDLPLIRYSLNPCMPGCQTNMVRIKQKHRRLEAELITAEKLASAAALQTGYAYPEQALEEAQRDLMMSQFHDILPGGCVPAGEETGVRILDHGLETVRRIRAGAFFALAANEAQAQPGTYPVLVYNPHPYPVTTQLDVSFILANQNWSSDFTDITAWSGDQALPTQVVREHSNLNLDWAKRVYISCTLQPMALNRLTLKPELRPGHPGILQRPLEFTTDRSTAAVDPETGMLCRYQVDGRELICSPLSLVLSRDTADTWAMGQAQLKKLAGEEIARFRLMTPEEAEDFLGCPGAPVRLIEDGPVVQEVESLLTCCHSRLRCRWRFFRDCPDIEVEMDLQFAEKDALIKWCLPLAFTGEIRGQEAFSQEILPADGREVSAQDWVMATDGQRHLGVLRRGTYGLSCTPGELQLTLVRGPGYAVHPIEDRPLIPDDRYIPRLDQGPHSYIFRLTGARPSRIERLSQCFAEPPYALQMFPTGNGSCPGSLLRLEGEGITLTAFRKSPDGGYIIRLYNSLDRENSCVCFLPDPGISQEIRFSPFAVRTFRLQCGSLTPCTRMEI